MKKYFIMSERVINLAEIYLMQRLIYNILIDLPA